MPILEADVLVDFARRIFQAVGAGEATAGLVAGSLVASNLAGHDSHGVIRVRQYLEAIAAGKVDPAATPVVAHESGAVVMVDARHGLGQAAAHLAMQLAIERAGSYGLAAAGLVNCYHIGRLGEWVELAAKRDMIGLAFCNGGHPGGLVAPYGGAGRLLGTNPVAAAIPVAGRPPVVVDLATSATAEGKVRLARNKGQAIPEGLILDAQGRPSTDPNDLYAGGMLLTAAGHKGYALSLLVEWLGGLLTGSGSPALPDYPTLRNGVLFLVLAVEAFRPLEAFLEQGAALSRQAKAVPPAPGFGEVLLPGEPEQRAAVQRRREGIAIDEATWAGLVEAAAGLGVAPPAEA